MSNDILGLQAAMAALRLVGGTVHDAEVKAAMQDCLNTQKIATVALAKVDTHTMEQSTVTRMQAPADNLIGQVAVTAQSPGGYPYAIRQHEDLTLGNGPKTQLKPAYDGMTPGAKFMERPFSKYRPRYIQRLQQGVWSAIRRRVPL